MLNLGAFKSFSFPILAIMKFHQKQMKFVGPLMSGIAGRHCTGMFEKIGILVEERTVNARDARVVVEV